MSCLELMTRLHVLRPDFVTGSPWAQGLVELETYSLKNLFLIKGPYVSVYTYLTQNLVAVCAHEKQAMFYGQKQRCWCFGFPRAASLFSAFDLSTKPSKFPDLEVIS